MADDLREIQGIAAGGKLVGHEGVTQVVNFGGFDAGDSEKAVDGGTDIAD